MSRVRDVQGLRTPALTSYSPSAASDRVVGPRESHSPFYDVADFDVLRQLRLPLPTLGLPSGLQSRKSNRGTRLTGQQHIVLNNPNSAPGDPSHFYWLYGFVEFKLTDDEDKTTKKTFRIVDRLMERLHKTGSKGCLLFDIISTCKHINSGLPHKLANAIYAYMEAQYFGQVITTFVGLTDNTARRVARDVFCRHPELSKQKYPFEVIDNLHMHIIYPPTDGHDLTDPTKTSPGFLARGGGGGFTATGARNTGAARGAGIFLRETPRAEQHSRAPPPLIVRVNKRGQTGDAGQPDFSDF